MSDKNDFAQTTTATPKKGGAVKRHCAKWWWVHLIIFIVIAVVVIILAIFVAVPRIAQDKINKAKLDIVSVEVLNPTPDEYTMKIASTIKTDGQVKADIDPFDGVMYLEDEPSQTPFVTLKFPKTNANKHQWVNFTQEHTKVTDLAAFTKFNTWFVNNETLRVTIFGKTKVQPKGLNRKSKVNFKKTLELKGLNLFKGLKVNNGKVDLSKKQPEINFRAETVLPNPSHFTLDIGNATFDNLFQDKSVGTIFINNLFLKPGDNTFPIQGSLDQNQVVKAVGATDGPNVPFDLVGKEVKNDGKDIKYFADALAHAKQHIELNVGEILANSA